LVVIVVAIICIKFLKQIINRFLINWCLFKKLLVETASLITRLCILQDHQVLPVPRDFRECGVNQGSQDLQDNQEPQAPEGYQGLLGKM
jgi:hypothetical protein